jgi:hypothetical protein
VCQLGVVLCGLASSIARAAEIVAFDSQTKNLYSWNQLMIATIHALNLAVTARAPGAHWQIEFCTEAWNPVAAGLTRACAMR